MNYYLNYFIINPQWLWLLIVISCIISACEQSTAGSRSVKEISCTTACHSTAALLQTGTSTSILTLHRHFLSARYLSGLSFSFERLMECIVDIKNWMMNNFLLLNSEKTDVLIIGPKNHTSNNLEHCLTLDGCSLDSSSSVRNLGVLFDSNLSFDSHVSSICKTEIFHLKNISELRPMSNVQCPMSNVKC